MQKKWHSALVCFYSFLVALTMYISASWAIPSHSMMVIHIRSDHDILLQISALQNNEKNADVSHTHSRMITKTEGFVSVKFNLPNVLIDEVQISLGSHVGIVEIKKIEFDQGILGNFYWDSVMLKNNIYKFKDLKAEVDSTGVLRLSLSGSNPQVFILGKVFPLPVTKEKTLRIIAGFSFFISLFSLFSTLKPQEQLSNVFGSLSTACFIFIIGVLVFMSNQYLEGLTNSQGLGGSRESQRINQVIEKNFEQAFPLRDTARAINYYLEVNLFSYSPVSKILIGKDGTIFYRSELVGDGMTIKDLRGLAPFTNEEVEKILTRLENMHQQLAKRKIKFIFLIAPNKETIYPELLPSYIAKTGMQTRMDQILSAISERTEIEVIDMRPVLLEKKVFSPLYFKYGSHWNMMGGYLAYLHVMNKVTSAFPEVTPLNIEEFVVSYNQNQTRQGWRSIIAMKEMMMDDDDILVSFSYKKTGEQLFQAEYKEKMMEMRYDAKYPNMRVMVLRDSFTKFVQPFLSLTFGSSSYWRSYNIDYAQIDQEKPDIVILQVVERYLELLR